MTSTRVMESW